MTEASQHHRQTMFIGRRNHFGVLAHLDARAGLGRAAQHDAVFGFDAVSVIDVYVIVPLVP